MTIYLLLNPRTYDLLSIYYLLPSLITRLITYFLSLSIYFKILKICHILITPTIYYLTHVHTSYYISYLIITYFLAQFINR
jgi:hypothetical protein